MKNRLKIYISFLITVTFFSTVFGQGNSEKIRVACVGNSVTFGARIEDREENCYPAQLQDLLGNKYEVGNFGKSGATLLTKGHRPYIQQQEFKEALKFNPHVVVIHLGLNDTDPRNWPNYRDEFTKDYFALIDSFNINSTNINPEIWICKMTPIFHGHPRFKSGTRDWFWQIQEKIRVVAKTKQTGLIDLHIPLYSHPDLFPDNVHPNEKGAKIIAETVYSELTGDFGGLHISEVFGNNMVLQRGIPIPVYGKANRDDRITIEFDGESKIVTPNEHGQWETEFPAKTAGGPFTLKIWNKDTTMQFDDILTGDVWLCSGQSNMAFQLKQTARAKEEIAKANYPEIRLYNMEAVVWAGKSKWVKEDLQKINNLKFYMAKWETCSPETAAGFSGVAFHFGRKLQEELNVPVGLIHNAKGGSPTEAWIDRETLEFHPQLVDLLSNWKQNDFVMDWCRERASYNIQHSENPLQRHPFHPAYLFESGILPLEGFPIKGVIWYQGESNAHNVELHEILFPALVKSWRNMWGENLPFYFVQLSSLNRPTWGHFRDSQRRLAKQIDNCEMVVSSDLGHPTDVHPKKKKEVGERLALIALKNTYKKDFEWKGPEIENISFKGNKTIVFYKHANNLKTSDGKSLRSFELAEEDFIFYPASAFVKGNIIELSSEKIKNPKYVRYAWQSFANGNLINEAGLPASTFSTEFEKLNRYE